MIFLLVAVISLVISVAVAYRVEKLHREIQRRLKANTERQKESEVFMPAFRKEDIERAVTDSSLTPLFVNDKSV